MADVQARAGGVREHVEHVELRLAGGRLGGESLVLVPVALPLGLDLVERVFLAKFRHKAGRLYGAHGSAASLTR